MNLNRFLVPLGLSILMFSVSFVAGVYSDFNTLREENEVLQSKVNRLEKWKEVCEILANRVPEPENVEPVSDIIITNSYGNVDYPQIIQMMCYRPIVDIPEECAGIGMVVVTGNVVPSHIKYKLDIPGKGFVIVWNEIPNRGLVR